MDETNGTRPPRSGSVLDDLKRLMAEYNELRAELYRERADLLERIRQIDVAIERFESDRGPPKGAAESSAPRAVPAADRTETIPGLLMSIVRKSPDGMTSKEVIAAAVKRRPKLKSNDVLAGLYRLSRKKHWLRTEGPKGAMRYFVTEPPAT
jgi:hypothetical protein